MGIVGRKDLFAIQWKPDVLVNDYYYGYLCFWIGGLKVGNFSELSTLSISISYLRDFLSYKSDRFLANSFQLNDSDLFKFLYDRFFSGESMNDCTYLLMSKFRETYWLDEVGEYSFRDKVGMVIIDEVELNRQRVMHLLQKTKVIFLAI